MVDGLGCSFLAEKVTLPPTPAFTQSGFASSPGSGQLLRKVIPEFALGICPWAMRAIQLASQTEKWELWYLTRWAMPGAREQKGLQVFLTQCCQPGRASLSLLHHTLQPASQVGLSCRSFPCSLVSSLSRNWGTGSEDRDPGELLSLARTQLRETLCYQLRASTHADSLQAGRGKPHWEHQHPAQAALTLCLNAGKNTSGDSQLSR